MKILLTLCLILTVTGVTASDVGKRYPSEKHAMTDRVTGAVITVLTSSAYNDAKPYQTHETWTSDGNWIVFRSNRNGNNTQLFVVNELTGDIIQLTDDPAVNAGSVNLSRKEMKMFFIRGGVYRQNNKERQSPRQVVELNTGQLIDDSMAGKVQKPEAYERVVVELPQDTEGSGLALDADESCLYWGVSLSRPDPAPQDRKQTDVRSQVDSRNTSLSESREAARARFEAAGRGHSGIRSIDIRTGRITRVIDVDLRMGHLQANPWVPGEIIYCHETTGDAVQRIWAVKADGSDHRPVYAETPDEWVTHETVAGPDELLFNIMGHLPYLREKPTGIAVVNLRTKQMKLLGQVEEDMGNGQLGGFWHCNGSPDRKWVTGDTFKGSVYVINRETGERRLLTTGHRMRPDHTHPIFSPDSKRVLIQSGMLTDGKALNLMVVQVE